MGPEENSDTLVLRVGKVNEHGESLKDLLSKHNPNEWFSWEWEPDKEMESEGEPASPDPTIRRVNPGLKSRKDL